MTVIVATVYKQTLRTLPAKGQGEHIIDLEAILYDFGTTP
jgi:hypothetical protein